jgi:hypothetical protein
MAWPCRQQDQTAYENLGATEKKLLLSSLIRYIVLKGASAAAVWGFRYV